MKCLIIEDDRYKLENIIKVLKENFPNIVIFTETAYKPSLRKALEPIFDFILLDMSMLTFNITCDEKGGRPRHYAGKEIILQMQYRNINTPVIVITQFENFGEGPEQSSLKDLIIQLEKINFKGYQETILYSMTGEDWQEKLINSIKKIMKL